MSRIIMLIPLDKDIGLTSIGLSIIYFFYQKKIKKKSVQSILYFSCTQNSSNSTSHVINKYFSKIVHTVDYIDFSKVLFNSPEYSFLLNKVIDEHYNNKFLRELILIEGIKNNYCINSEEMNYDISQNLNAEVIFIANLENSSPEYIKNKEKKINFFLKQKKYKNILGVIFNQINSPFLENKYDFIKKLIVLKKIKNETKTIVPKKILKNNFFSIIACIPWNRNIVTTRVIDLFNFLNIQHTNLVQKKNHIIEEIIIFDTHHLNLLNKHSLNTLVIVSFSRIDVFLNVLNCNVNRSKVKCIILTGILKLKKNIASLYKFLIKRSISIFFTEKNTIEILSQLQNFNFDISVKDITYIKKLQRYISNFFCHSSVMFFKKKYNINVIYPPKEFCYNLKLLSQKKNKRIILPESYEIRILKSVAICSDSNIAQCVLLGDPKKIYSIANDNGINLKKNIEIIDPISVRQEYLARFLEIRKGKNINEFSAKKQLEDNTVLATLILESNHVDGLVSGSINTTSDTIRPALQIIKTNPQSLLVSSIFFMLLPNQVLIYGDCAININPTAEELAVIAIQSADSAKMFGIEPRIAMLSYSTGCSGFGCQVEKVKEATSIIKNRRSDLIIDGPIQYDAAVSNKVAKLKAPSSPISGSANVFIFPDLNSGNIAYKAVQRSSRIVSIGPMLQGLRKPVNDLSRGASVEDIIYTIALTSIQSE
ncbi:phosphate acetyltransferase [Buchnera aphidicola]|uniref:Phosphate acetyltransferase n=2 Tax=Buchnera aphidicola TaxID=9 RepID=A0A7U4DIC3_BUCA5|nr:phosphate acetyltransferase [Buchnera aphidicola]ACL30548.1 phosphate acetyltransferase [Buchnera aphidicola str. 5A (Acyrthosiphon pisum)]